MAIEIPIRNNRASFSQNLTILGQSTTLELNFNSTDAKWRLSVYDSTNAPILEGIVLTPGQSPTKKYSLTYFIGGNFWVFKKKETDDPLKYDNFGFDLSYGLFFITDDEEVELGL